MPTANVAKAAVASRRNREYNSGRRHERYADDPEEEQGLLGSATYEDGENEEDERGTNLVRTRKYLLEALLTHLADTCYTNTNTKDRWV